MVMDWGDTFSFGMYSGYQVKEVFDSRPSYLIWLRVNTSKKLAPRVMDALIRKAHEGPWKLRDRPLVSLFISTCGGPGPW